MRRSFWNKFQTTKHRAGVHIDWLLNTGKAMKIKLRTTGKWNDPVIFVTFVIVGICFCSAEEFKINYNPKETAALEKFRDLVSDVLNTDSTKTDEYLIRWIRDSKFDFQRASTKLRKAVEWRKRIQIESLNIEDLNGTFPFYNTAGLDRTGSPIYSFNFGSWDVRKLAVAGKRPALKRHLDAFLEHNLKQIDALRKQGQNVSQWILLGDLAGLNLRQHLCLACFPIYAEFILDIEQNYPETIKHLVGINSPRIFEPVLDVIRPIMSPGTRKGLKVFDNNKADWQGWFQSICEPNKLLIRLGGTRDRL